MRNAGLYISSFLKKSSHDKWLLLRVFLLLFWIRFLLFILPFRRFAKRIGEAGKETTNSNDDLDWTYIETISRFIRNFSKIVPWDSRCLAQAAAGKVLMRKNGIPATVYFGVKKGDETEKIKAHAWLRVGPKIVLGGENAGQFTVVQMFS